jgi:hypothetical protein
MRTRSIFRPLATSAYVCPWRRDLNTPTLASGLLSVPITGEGLLMPQDPKGRADRDPPGGDGCD